MKKIYQMVVWIIIVVFVLGVNTLSCLGADKIVFSNDFSDSSVISNWSTTGDTGNWVIESGLLKQLKKDVIQYITINNLTRTSRNQIGFITTMSNNT